MHRYVHREHAKQKSDWNQFRCFEPCRAADRPASVVDDHNRDDDADNIKPQRSSFAYFCHAKDVQLQEIKAY